jgi:hypothetical protein
MSEMITLSYTTSTNVTLTASKTLADGTGTGRIVPAVRDRLSLDPNSTPTQVFAALAAELFDMLRQNVVNYERQQAARTAAAGVADITLT